MGEIILGILVAAAFIIFVWLLMICYEYSDIVLTILGLLFIVLLILLPVYYIWRFIQYLIGLKKKAEEKAQWEKEEKELQEKVEQYLTESAISSIKIDDENPPSFFGNGLNNENEIAGYVLLANAIYVRNGGHITLSVQSRLDRDPSLTAFYTEHYDCDLSIQNLEIPVAEMLYDIGRRGVDERLNEALRQGEPWKHIRPEAKKLEEPFMIMLCGQSKIGGVTFFDLDWNTADIFRPIRDKSSIFFSEKDGVASFYSGYQSRSGIPVKYHILQAEMLARRLGAKVTPQKDNAGTRIVFGEA